MLSSDAAVVLDSVEADNRAVLYKARWDETTAADIVPKLSAILDSDDRDLLLRALRAFVTIGPAACDAAPRITRHLHSQEPWVFQAAAIALALVSLNKPDAAIQALAEAAVVPGQEKYAVLALIQFGKAAKCVAPIFVRAFENRSARIRCLALRGLAAIGSDGDLLSTVLRQATNDKSKQVREYAFRLTSQRESRGTSG
jgi:hypothetical protein